MCGINFCIYHQETEPEGDDEFLRVDYACPEFPKALLDKVEGVVPEVEYTGMQSSGTGQALLAQSLEHIRKSFENLSPVFSSSKQVMLSLFSVVCFPSLYFCSLFPGVNSGEPCGPRKKTCPKGCILGAKTCEVGTSRSNFGVWDNE